MVVEIWKSVVVGIGLKNAQFLNAVFPTQNTRHIHLNLISPSRNETPSILLLRPFPPLTTPVLQFDYICQLLQMVSHNNALQKNHFHKDWQVCILEYSYHHRNEVGWGKKSWNKNS